VESADTSAKSTGSPLSRARAQESKRNPSRDAPRARVLFTTTCKKTSTRKKELSRKGSHKKDLAGPILVRCRPPVAAAAHPIVASEITKEAERRQTRISNLRAPTFILSRLRGRKEEGARRASTQTSVRKSAHTKSTRT
jgi:hypothetical protein